MPSPTHLAIEEGRIQLFWLTNPNASIVCEKLLRYNPGRSWVTLAHWGEQIVIAKLFSNHKEAHVLLNNASILLEAKINILNMLYNGWTNDKSLYVILFEQLESAQDLEVVWQFADDATRVLLLQKLINIFVKMHQAGLKPNEIDFKNFLLKDGEIYVEQFALIQVSHDKQPLSELTSIKNLALLFAQLPLEWDLVCDQFYAFYMKQRNFIYTVASLTGFKKALAEVRRQRLLHVDETAFKTTHHWIMHKQWQRFWVCDRGYDTYTMHQLLTSLPDTFNRLEAETVATEDDLITYKTVVNGLTLSIKRYAPKNIGQALTQMFTGSPAAICWREAQRARLLGQATVKPVAMLEMRFGPLRLASYFITEYMAEKNLSQPISLAYSQYA